jgi:hypothetical protein
MCCTTVAPQESHLFSGAAEHVHGFLPERSRLGMWTVVVATSDADGIGRSLMRHHRIVPCRQSRSQRKSFRSANGISD